MELFERPQGGGERAVLVHIEFNRGTNSDALNELRELVLSAGAEPVDVVTGRRRAPDPRSFIGSGKVEDIRLKIAELDLGIVIFNHTLSPAQERNLERALQCRVLDRTGLILDIFAQRARTFEGKLQVELAQLKYLSTRLVRGWTHLERQKGGIGLRGPGETQLETDRRLIGARIKQLNKRLDKVSKQRQGQRKARLKSNLLNISLVGYTNTGKSTLFNRLAGADVLVADQLFATLDPTLRRVTLNATDSIILADTVGFIRHLPHSLVVAFRATLEETEAADLLIHVVDAHDENRTEHIDQVNEVLKEVGAECIPQLLVYNKIDLLEDGQARMERDEHGMPRKIWISAVTGEGLPLLRKALSEFSQKYESLRRE
ncbi:Ribosome LSU-associated GTP-binding protein HflX [hydrothermal vent metagenome]|uniref:Ribosome LSU-associated GTP-binding protein HflX n=1 Tax=hydrothermal vent metagenome TaxID=652676 RepID=A0A3B0YSC5_9ZZZZ